jgi:phosphoglycolate phosphatase
LSPTLRGLLVDLDGTVADSIDFFYAISCEVLAAAGVPAPERSAILAAIADGVIPHDRFLPRDLADRDAFLAGVVRDRWPGWLERYQRDTLPHAGACAALERLCDGGLRLALVTSSTNTLPLLERWNVRRCFPVVVGREDVKRIKPDPEPIRLALERLGLEPDEVLCIGDTPLDVRAALAAGVATIGVLSGAGTEDQLRAAGALEVLASLADVPDFLARPPLVGLRSRERESR